MAKVVAHLMKRGRESRLVEEGASFDSQPMKVVLDIETIQAPREEWARLVGVDSVARESCEGSDTDLFTHAEAR